MKCHVVHVLLNGEFHVLLSDGNMHLRKARNGGLFKGCANFYLCKGNRRPDPEMMRMYGRGLVKTQ